MNTKTPRRLVIGISGASGTIYGVRMLEILKKTDIETHLVMSKSAEMTLVYETKFKPKDVRTLASTAPRRMEATASPTKPSNTCSRRVRSPSAQASGSPS